MSHHSNQKAMVKLLAQEKKRIKELEEKVQEMGKERDQLKETLIWRKEGTSPSFSQVGTSIKRKIGDLKKKAHDLAGMDDPVMDRIDRVLVTKEEEETTQKSPNKPLSQGMTLDLFDKRDLIEQGRIIQLEAELIALREEKESIQKQSIHYQKKLDDSENERTILRRSIQEISPSAELIPTLNKTIEELRKRTVDLEKQKCSAQEAADRTNLLDKRYASLQEQHSQAYDDLQKQTHACHTLSRQVEFLTKESQEKKFQCQNKDEEIVKLKMELSDTQDQIRNVKRQLIEKDGALQEAQVALAKRLKQSSMLQATIDQQKLDLMELGNEIAENESQKQELSLKATLTEEKAQEARIETQAAQGEFQSLFDRYSHVQSELRECVNRLHDLETESKRYEHMESRYEHMHAVFSNIQESIGHLTKAKGSKVKKKEKPQTKQLDLFDQPPIDS